MSITTLSLPMPFCDEEKIEEVKKDLIELFKKHNIIYHFGINFS